MLVDVKPSCSSYSRLVVYPSRELLYRYTMKIVEEVTKGPVEKREYLYDFIGRGYARFSKGMLIPFAIIVDWAPLCRIMTEACREIPWIEVIYVPQKELINNNRLELPDLEPLYIIVQANYSHPDFLRELIHVGEIKDILDNTSNKDEILQRVACKVLAKELDRKLRPKLRETFMLDV